MHTDKEFVFSTKLALQKHMYKRVERILMQMWRGQLSDSHIHATNPEPHNHILINQTLVWSYWMLLSIARSYSHWKSQHFTDIPRLIYVHYNKLHREIISAYSSVGHETTPYVLVQQQRSNEKSHRSNSANSMNYNTMLQTHSAWHPLLWTTVPASVTMYKSDTLD